MIKRIASLRKTSTGTYVLTHFTYCNGMTVDHGTAEFDCRADALAAKIEFLGR